MNNICKVEEINKNKANVTAFGIFLGLERKAGNSNPFLVGEFKDETGKIPIKVWNCDDDNKILSDDIMTNQSKGFKIEAEVNDYKGNLGLIIKKVDVCIDYDVSPFANKIDESIETLIEYIKDECKSIQSRTLRGIVSCFWSDLKYSFARLPGGIRMHHNQLGGLLQHTSEILRHINTFQVPYGKINMDLLKSGAILHDMGKVFEYEISDLGAIKMNPKSVLYSHIDKDIYLLAKYEMLTRNKIGEDFNEEELELIHHMLVSHHGKLEYGSTKVPAIPEAMILSSFDDLDAKLNNAFSLLSNIQEGESFYSREGTVYKPIYTSKKTST